MKEHITPEVGDVWEYRYGLDKYYVVAILSDRSQTYDNSYEIYEVLEKVPSYEEWQKLLSDQLAKNEGEEINAELEAENTKLKELLKECKEHFITYKRDDLDKGYVVYDGSYLIAKINQVLGEE